MDCKRAKSLIPYAVDGELSDDLYVDLQSHLAVCDDCAGLFASHTSVIDDLGRSFHTLSDSIVLPDDYAATVLSRASGHVNAQYTCFESFYSRFIHYIDTLLSKRRFSYAISFALIIALVFLIGSSALKLLDSTPIVSTKVTPGNFIAFTVRPSQDGRVVAGVNTHSYCRVIRSTEESLR